VAQELKEIGFTRVFALKGGWDEWLRADYPTEKK
jgi:rhodanese-related sulfurtransferase